MHFVWYPLAVENVFGGTTQITYIYFKYNQCILQCVLSCSSIDLLAVHYFHTHCSVLHV